MSSHWLIWSLIACLATSPPLPTLPGDTPNLTPDSSSGFLLRPNCGNRAAATIAVIAFVVGPANPRPLLNEAGAVPHCPRKGGETGIRTKSQGRNSDRRKEEGKEKRRKREEDENDVDDCGEDKKGRKAEDEKAAKKTKADEEEEERRR